MAKIEPFERHAQKYEDWFTRNKFAYQAELQAISKQLPQRGTSIGIGVGSGHFAAPLGITVGIEPSSKLGDSARQRGINIVRAVAEALPFDDSQFDFALMVAVICFLDNIETAFKETYRVLKPDGHLIIGFIDKESSIGKLYQQHKRESVFYKIATFYSVAEVVHHLKKANFKDFNFTQTIFHNLTEVKHIEPIRRGYGEGSFVVAKATK